MEDDQLYDKFIVELKKKIGSSRQINAELCEFFDKPKEWLYRRLKGVNPFTFTEAVALSRKYRIPIDRISGLRKMEKEEQAAAKPAPAPVPVLEEATGFSPVFVEDEEYGLLVRYSEILDILSQSEEPTIRYFCHTLPMALFFAYDKLSDYYLFRNRYYEDYKGEATPLSEIHVPDKIRALQRDIACKSQQIKNNVIVLDDSVIANTINEIRFFHCAGLLTAEEIEELKKELSLLIRYMRRVAAMGSFDDGGNVTMYSTSLNFETTCIFFNSDNIEKCMQGSVILSGYHVYQTLLQRMEASRRSSVMITNSGGLHRAMFFKRQQYIVDSLTAQTTTLSCILS